MDEMIERVARAMFAAQWDAQDRPEEFDLNSEGFKAIYWAAARAAVAAMREPTDDMVRAAHLKAEGMTSAGFADVWRAMIDVVLDDGRGRD